MRDTSQFGCVWIKGMLVSFGGMLLSGCLAQQADLIQTRVELDDKIARLDKKEREIQIQVDLAKKLIEDQKQQVDQLVKETRARLRSEISELRDEAMPRIQGTLDEQSKQVRDLAKGLDDRTARFDQLMAKRDHELSKREADSDKRFSAVEKALEKALNDQAAAQAASQKADRDYLYGELVKLGSRLDETGKSVVEVTKKLEARIQEHDRTLNSWDAKTGGLAQQVDQQGRGVSEQMTMFGKSLTEFKQVLTGLSEKLIQQERTTQELSANLNKRNEALNAKNEALIAKSDADAKVTMAHLNEVNKSVGSVAKAVETLGATFVTKIEQQEQRLGDLSGHVNAIGSRVEQQEQRFGEISTALQTVTSHVQQQEQRFGEVSTTLQTVTSHVQKQDQWLGEVSGALQTITSQMDTQNQVSVPPRPATPETGPNKRSTKPVPKRVGELEPVQRFAQKSDPLSDLLVQAPALKEVGVDTQTAAPSSIQAAVGGSAPDVATKDPAAAVAESPRETIKLNPRDQYDAVLAKFKQGDLEGAQRGFTDFLSRYPTSDLAPNAQYWLGECYYGKRDYRRAIEAFDLVKHVYPRSEKVPAALLKQSLAYIEVNERKRATVLLQEILESYPKSPEAGRAEAKLAQLGRKR